MSGRQKFAHLQGKKVVRTHGTKGGEGEDAGADDGGEGGDGSEGGEDGGEGGSDDGGEDGGKGEGGKTYTDDEVNEIIKKKQARWKRQWEAEQSKKNKEGENALSEAERLKNMNAQEKAEYEAEKLRQKVENLERKEARAELLSEGREMVEEAGITVSDKTLKLLISDDADETKESIEGFIESFKSEVDKAVKEALKRKPPRGGNNRGNDSGSSTTAAQRAADRINRQRGYVSDDSNNNDK